MDRAANENFPNWHGPWPPTKSMALALGANSYFNGKVCLRGHVAPRSAASANCKACAYEDGVKKRTDPETAEEYREYQAAYQRRRRQDPVKLARIQERARATSKKPEQVARKSAQRKRRMAEDAELRARVNERDRPKKVAWKKNNPEVVKAHGQNRRSALLGAEGNHTASDIRRLNEEQGFTCVYCETSTEISFHVDHKTPLSRGGSNWPDNLQILCAGCNLSKGAKTDEEFRLWLAAANDNQPKSDDEDDAAA